MHNLTNQRQNGRVRTIVGPDSSDRDRDKDGDRIKCEACGMRQGMHIYKLDPSYYFCGNCAYKVPVADVKPKPEATVEPVDGDNTGNRREQGKTFIASIPRRRRRTPYRRGIMEDALRKRGLQL